MQSSKGESVATVLTIQKELSHTKSLLEKY
jgi:hypothetical protein